MCKVILNLSKLLILLHTVINYIALKDTYKTDRNHYGHLSLGKVLYFTVKQFWTIIEVYNANN